MVYRTTTSVDVADVRLDAVQPHPSRRLTPGPLSTAQRRQSRETCDTRTSAAVAVCMAQGTTRPGGGGGDPHERLGTNRRAARARPELKRERQWGLGTRVSAALCCHCQRSPASSPVSLRSQTSCHPHHRTQRPLRTRTGIEYPSPPPPSHPPPPSSGLTAPGQHLAASIGSTDPPIARLPFWGLATRDKAEGAPPSALQTAHEIHIQHTIIATTASCCDHPPRLATSNHVQRASRHGPAWAGTAGHPSG